MIRIKVRTRRSLFTLLTFLYRVLLNILHDIHQNEKRIFWERTTERERETETKSVSQTDYIFSRFTATVSVNLDAFQRWILHALGQVFGSSGRPEVTSCKLLPQHTLNRVIQSENTGVRPIDQISYILLSITMRHRLRNDSTALFVMHKTINQLKRTLQKTTNR